MSSPNKAAALKVACDQIIRNANRLINRRTLRQATRAEKYRPQMKATQHNGENYATIQNADNTRESCSHARRACA